MKTILCNDCGATMSRFSNFCAKCSRTNLEFFEHDSPILKERIKQLRGGVDLYTRLACAALIAGLAFVIVHSYGNSLDAKRHAQAAAAAVKSIQ